MENTNFKPKSFWSRPEGTTGAVFLTAIIAGIGYLVATNLAFLVGLAASTLGLVAILAVLALIIYMALDSRTRTLIGYLYKSVMRWITGIFITIDPIGILKNYVDDLKDNLKKMGKQIGNLKGQMRKLKNIVAENNKEIENNLLIAKKAKELGDQKSMLLSTRKAGRLKESNSKYSALHNKMSILYKVLSKMYTNSEILLEDTEDQVRVKEQERKAIKASHSAMSSAMSIIKGDKDKRALFDQTMEAMADDVANKVGEMERFMELSSDFMNSVDLQNGVFEEKGLKMLEEYEKKSTLLLLGGQEKIDDEDVLDLKTLDVDIQESGSGKSNSGYDNLFD